MRPSVRAAALGVAALVSVLVARAGWPDCQPLTLGLDTTYATNSTATAFDDAFAEVLYAPDTLVTSVTIWRSFFIDSDFVGVKLYIANLDSLGRPNPFDLVLDGPTVFHVSGDSIHPTPFQFTFNPPVALPHRGSYEFAFQSAPCGYPFFFIYNSKNAYAQGSMWWHGQNFACGLRNDATEFPTQDLVFQVEFCQPSTPALPVSWGRLKHTYR